jgi:hypothetical protein
MPFEGYQPKITRGDPRDYFEHSFSSYLDVITLVRVRIPKVSSITWNLSECTEPNPYNLQVPFGFQGFFESTVSWRQTPWVVFTYRNAPRKRVRLMPYGRPFEHLCLSRQEILNLDDRPKLDYLWFYYQCKTPQVENPRYSFLVISLKLYCRVDPARCYWALLAVSRVPLSLDWKYVYVINLGRNGPLQP